MCEREHEEDGVATVKTVIKARTTVRVTIHLVDFVNTQDQFQDALKNKFKNQSVGFIKWFSRREELLNTGCKFIPVEFAQDKILHLHQKLESISQIVTRKNNVKSRFLPTAWYQNIRNDKDCMFHAIHMRRATLKDASHNLRKDATIVLEAVRQNGLALQYARKAKKYREIVMTAVRENGEAIQFASDDLKKDKQVGLLAVKQNGLALKHLTQELKNDFDIVVEAINQNGEALQYASSDMRRNMTMILKCVKMDPKTIVHALLDSETNILDVVAMNGKAINYLPNTQLKKDRNVILNAIPSNLDALSHATKQLRSDKSFMMEAIRLNPKAFKYATQELQQNEDLIELVNSAPPQIRTPTSCNSSTVCKKKEKTVLNGAKEKLLLTRSDRNNRSKVLEAVKKNGYALSSASNSLQYDKELIIEAVKQNGYFHQDNLAGVNLFDTGEICSRKNLLYLISLRISKVYGEFHIPPHYKFDNFKIC